MRLLNPYFKSIRNVINLIPVWCNNIIDIHNFILSGLAFILFFVKFVTLFRPVIATMLIA